MPKKEGEDQTTEEGIPDEKKYTDFSRPLTLEKVKRDKEGNSAAAATLAKELAKLRRGEGLRTYKPE